MTLWNGSSAGMSVRLTRERSWVRTPSVPLLMPQDLFCVLRHIAVCSFTVFHKKFIILSHQKKDSVFFRRIILVLRFFPGDSKRGGRGRLKEDTHDDPGGT